MKTDNQKIINDFATALNKVENDAEFMRRLNQEAEREAELARLRYKTNKIAEEVVRWIREWNTCSGKAEK